MRKIKGESYTASLNLQNSILWRLWAITSATFKDPKEDQLEAKGVFYGRTSTRGLKLLRGCAQSSYESLVRFGCESFKMRMIRHFAAQGHMTDEASVGVVDVSRTSSSMTRVV